MKLSPGKRIKSQVCSTVVIVVRGGDVDVKCGGHPMVDINDDVDDHLTLDPTLADGNVIGKRYVDADTNLELLVTAPGSGTLVAGEQAMSISAPKPLPASD